MTRVRALAAVALALALTAAKASAAPPRAAITAEVVPALGSGAAMPEGWVSFVVWLKNPRPSEVSGFVELEATPAWARSETRVLTKAPFALAPGAHVALELPTHGFSSTPAEFELRVLDENGTALTAGPVVVPDLKHDDPELVDLSAPSRIAPGLRGIALAVRRGSSGGYRAPSAIVTTPPVNPATGDLMLPRFSAGFAGATLVTASAKKLATLGRPELAALVNWVLAGGALAVSVERPEDTTLDVLARLAGGPIRREAASRELFESADFVLAPDATAAPSTASPLGGGHGVVLERRAPRAETAALLEGFSGGNLRPSPWGAVASYGLGELHLLAFDLGEPFASDRWVTLKLADLLRHAWERQTAVLQPLGRTAFDSSGADAVRSLLDPNRTVRWTIVVAALLLLGYAAVAGPLSFWLATRRGRPLRALLHLPFWAAGTLAAIVVLGFIGKGVRGRARHFTLAEAGAGMERAAAARFRGFYAPSSREIVVRPVSRGNLIDVAQGDTFVERTLVVDRDGARLEHLRTKPWATVVAREDGFLSLAGGISITPDAEGGVLVKNRTARDLVGVVLKPPGRAAVGFSRIKDGQRVREQDGEALSPQLGTAPVYTLLRPLGTSFVAETLDGYAEGLSRAWTTLEALGNNVNFWPDDVPVLLAQLDGGEGTRSDAGFDVDQDRVLVRIVGFGGVP